MGGSASASMTAAVMELDEGDDDDDDEVAAPERKGSRELSNCRKKQHTSPLN